MDVVRTLTERDKRILNVWKRKHLRVIYGPIRNNSDWRIRRNELTNLCHEDDLVEEVKKRPVAGVIEWVMAEWQKIDNKPDGRRKDGRPRLR